MAEAKPHPIMETLLTTSALVWSIAWLLTTEEEAVYFKARRVGQQGVRAAMGPRFTAPSFARFRAIHPPLFFTIPERAH